MNIFEQQEYPIITSTTAERLNDQFTQKPMIVPLTRGYPRQGDVMILHENPNIMPIVAIVGFLSFLAFLAFLAYTKK